VRVQRCRLCQQATDEAARDGGKDRDDHSSHLL
jgi:hypothetical protein